MEIDVVIESPLAQNYALGIGVLVVQETEIRRFIRFYNSSVKHWWEKITGWEVLPYEPVRIQFFDCKNRKVLCIAENELQLSRRRYGIRLS